MNYENDKIAKAWISGESSETLDTIVEDDPRRALAIINLIVGQADESDLASVGAGPLEDLLSSGKASDVTDDVLALARRSKNWRFALGCVWTSNFKDLKLKNKVESALNIYFPEGRP